MGRGRLLQLLSASLSPCCPYHPAGAKSTRRSGFVDPCCLRLNRESSASGVHFVSGPPMGSLALRPDDSLTIPKMALSVGFRTLGFPPVCDSSYRAPDSCPGGTDSRWMRQPSTGRTVFPIFVRVDIAHDSPTPISSSVERRPTPARDSGSHSRAAANGIRRWLGRWSPASFQPCAVPSRSSEAARIRPSWSWPSASSSPAMSFGIPGRGCRRSTERSGSPSHASGLVGAASSCWFGRRP